MIIATTRVYSVSWEKLWLLPSLSDHPTAVICWNMPGTIFTGLACAGRALKSCRYLGTNISTNNISNEFPNTSHNVWRPHKHLEKHGKILKCFFPLLLMKFSAAWVWVTYYRKLTQHNVACWPFHKRLRCSITTNSWAWVPSSTHTHLLLPPLVFLEAGWLAQSSENRSTNKHTIWVPTHQLPGFYLY